VLLFRAGAQGVEGGSGSEGRSTEVHEKTK
jgi:hypothetical protein